MKTLAEIEHTVDLDARVISAAAFLEYELQQATSPADRGKTLGELVQQETSFGANGFLRDVNFALGVRNAIAHYTAEKPPAMEEKERAADYLIQAVKLIHRRTGKSPHQGEAKDVFDNAVTQAALSKRYRRQIKFAALQAGFVIMGTIILCIVFREQVPAMLLFSGGLFVAGITVINGFDHKPMSTSQYYSLPGSHFDNGDHRCIHCGQRGRSGRGIYTHGKYKSSTKFHECSKCKTLLFTS